MSTHPNAPAEGEILAGKYRVERVLGAGGMGVVVAAMHLVLGQRVAIKFLLQNATQEVVARFLREARAAARLKSEHVARVLDVGELPTGAPYMVMEYLDGNDLAQVVRRRGPLPVDEAIGHVLHACEGIAEAHARGIIHRDLKPANLFLTRAADGSDTVKVLDFGISKTLDEPSDEGDDMQLTKTTAVLGSPLYMSPDQLSSARSVTAQSDIWSIGAILFQLLTGKVPFNATTFAELVLMVGTQPPTPIATYRRDVPAAVEEAILRCLSREREARFSNVGELAWAIAGHGPPDASAAAERISRTLEEAGLKVQRPSAPSARQGAAPASLRGPVSRPATADESGSGAMSQRPPAGDLSHQGAASRASLTGASPSAPSEASQAAVMGSTEGLPPSTIGGTQSTIAGTRSTGRAAPGPWMIAVMLATLAVAGATLVVVLRSLSAGPPAPATASPLTSERSVAPPAVTPATASATAAASSAAATPSASATATASAGTPTSSAAVPGSRPGATATHGKTEVAPTTTRPKTDLELDLEH